MVENKKSLYIEDSVLKDLEQDIFGHKHIADAVVESILHTQPPFTIGIFGGWGVGKSTLLDIVENKLRQNNVTVAKIDAWRYSASDNLSRAFLIHIAKELKPKLLDELHEELFYSKQVVSSQNQSSIYPSQKTLKEKTLSSLKRLLDILIKSIFLFSFLLFIMFSVFLMFFVIEHGGLQQFQNLFDWQDFKDKLISFAFIPLLLAIVDDIRLNFIQQPATIFRERIDADELFSQYFDKVVEDNTKGIISKKRLVIFVDNLDRLSDDKMVEALEGLKTYLNNSRCIFVVACDDNVVRSVINDSKKIPNRSSGKKKDLQAGEHYLDKFFQQTFRLPEYMTINLHDFAIQNLKTTQIYDELQNVDIDYLVSIILPSHVNSPRKVKRLLNEFISLYEIVKRRESKGDGQLRPGQLSTNVEFLGRFSTLRAEFPEFYQLLIKNPVLLRELTDKIRQKVESSFEINELIDVPNEASLISYIRKTETIMVDDIDTYIWLSQDRLSLELPSNIVNQIRIALINNEPSRFMDVLNETENLSEKVEMIRLANRIVQSLVGIDQQNGVKVLAYLLPNFDDAVKTEVAHVVADIMTRRLEEHSAREILNILRWAKRGTVTVVAQRRKLVDQILALLEKEDTREKTLSAVLENADVVDQNNATTSVKEWLGNLLKIENQKQLSPQEPNAEIASNNAFADWILSQIEVYSSKDFVVDNYFAEDLVDYMVRRLFGKELGLEGVYLSDDGVGRNISKIFEFLTNRVKENIHLPQYWVGLNKILEEASIIEDVKFACRIINDAIGFVPELYFEKISLNCFKAVDKLSRKVGNDKVEDAELIDLVREVSALTVKLRESKKQELSLTDLPDFPLTLQNLLANLLLQDTIFDFLTEFSRKFSGVDSETLLSGLVLLSESDNPIEQDRKLIDKILELNNFIGEKNRSKLIIKFHNLVQANNADKLRLIIEYLQKVVKIPEYQEGIMVYAGEWLEGISNDGSLIGLKTEALDIFISGNLLSADLFVEKLIKLLPVGGDSQQLNIFFTEIEKIKASIQDDMGVRLFSATVANISPIGNVFPKALEIVSAWYDNSNLEDKLSFDQNVISFYIASPVVELPIDVVSWDGVTSDQITENLIKIYRHEINVDLFQKRDIATRKALEVIEANKLEETVTLIWQQLINDREASEEFMSVAKGVLSMGLLTSIRQNAIFSIRDIENEGDLRLLASTFRHGLRDGDEIVSLFVNLFGRGADVVQMATKYVVQCIKPFDIKSDNKYLLAEAMSKAIINSEDDIYVIEEKAKELKLKWFKYKGK